MELKELKHQQGADRYEATVLLGEKCSEDSCAQGRVIKEPVLRRAGSGRLHT